MASSPLFTAQLAIYAVLAIPVLFLLWKHSRHGFLGWGYLFIFCTLRVVGGAMAMNSHDDNSGADIISSIGISPLLLALDGLLHESKIYRNPNLHRKLEWIFILIIHILVASGVALVGVGSSALTTHATTLSAADYYSDLTLLKTGMGILTGTWIILCIAAVLSLVLSSGGVQSRSHYQAQPVPVAWREGSLILYAVLIGLALVGIRVIYALVAQITQNSSLNPITGSLGVRVGLSLVPELVATLVFVGAGWVTRDVKKSKVWQRG